MERSLLLEADDRASGSPSRPGRSRCLTLVATIPSARLSDRVGRKPVIYAACVIGGLGMAITASRAGDRGVRDRRDLHRRRSGTFLAVDWALMTDIIPKASSGRYMGISNIAVVARRAVRVGHRRGAPVLLRRRGPVRRRAAGRLRRRDRAVRPCRVLPAPRRRHAAWRPAPGRGGPSGGLTADRATRDLCRGNNYPFCSVNSRATCHPDAAVAALPTERSWSSAGPRTRSVTASSSTGSRPSPAARMGSSSSSRPRRRARPRPRFPDGAWWRPAIC